MMVFIAYVGDYTEPMPLRGPFESEDDALVWYLTELRADEPDEFTSRPDETDAETARRIYLTDDSVRLARSRM